MCTEKCFSDLIPAMLLPFLLDCFHLCENVSITSASCRYFYRGSRVLGFYGVSGVPDTLSVRRGVEISGVFWSMEIFDAFFICGYLWISCRNLLSTRAQSALYPWISTVFVKAAPKMEVHLPSRMDSFLWGVCFFFAGKGCPGFPDGRRLSLLM